MKTLYVAEDDATLLQLMKVVLGSMAGLECSFFADGLTLLQHIQKAPPDGVVSDVILPKLEGLSVARLVKFDERYRNIRFMIISSVTDADIEEQVRWSGADGFLGKPFRPAVFREKVKELLGL